MNWFARLVHAVLHKPHLPDMPDDTEAIGAFRQGKQIRVSARTELNRTIEELLEKRDRSRA